MCKKCICLIRVSTKSQDLEAQKEKVVANAIADGYTKDEISIIEKKESAIKLAEMERESLNEMKDIIKENPTIESVYVFAIDRLARRVSVVLSVKEFLTDRNINLVFINPHKMATLIKDEKTGKIEEDKLTSMMLLFLSYGAEMEMKLKQERFKAAKETMQKQKKLTSGKPIFGYKKNEDGTISVNEDEAKVIRQIYYEVLVNNKAIKQVEREMIAKGFIKPKEIVTGSTIRYYCANKAYYGSTSTYGSIMEYPPIITKDEFEKMQQKMAENRKGAKKNTKQTHLCKGLIRNADSGYIMVYNSGSRSYVDYANHQNINAPMIDAIVWECTLLIYVLSEYMNDQRKKYSNKDLIKENEEKINNIKTIIDSLEEKQRKAFKMYLDGKVNDTIYNEEISKIENEHKKWLEEVAKLETLNKRFEIEGEELGNKRRWSADKLKEIEDIKVIKEVVDDLIGSVKVKKVEKGKYIIDITPKDTAVENIINQSKQITKGYIYEVKGHKITISKVVNAEKNRDITNRIKGVADKLKMIKEKV